MNNSVLDVAMSREGHYFSFADWLDRAAKQFQLTDAQIAEQYYTKLRHLMRPNDGRKAENGRPSENQSPITAWRNGKKIPGPDVAYRLGRALEELGVPVTGLSALIAGHYFDALLGTVGSHISIAVARTKPLFAPVATETQHISGMLEALAPAISRELTFRKMALGIRAIDVEEFIALQNPLPGGELYPKDQTPFVDAGFVAWTYDEKDASQRLPPSFAAAIALVKNLTPEVVELAADHLAHAGNDLMSLFALGTPRWVLRACGEDEEPHEHREPEPEPDYTNLNNFFDAYEAEFALPGRPGGFRQSAAYPGADLKLCASEYNEPGTAIEIDYLLVDTGTYSQKTADILDYLKNLAGQHALKLISWPADEGDIPFYIDHGFGPCHAWHAMGRRIEWPRCDHKKD